MDPFALLESPTVLQFALFLRDLGFLVYGGGIFAFALLSLLSARLGGPSTALILRVYRAFGPGLGLGLGATVLGALTFHYGTVGAFTWGAEAATGGAVGFASWLVFFGIWASNIQLEVWTLEPLRKLDPDGSGQATDATRLDKATKSVVRHLGVQAVMVVLLVGLVRLS